MRARDYAEAFVDCLDRPESDHQSLIERLISVAEQNGHRNLLPKIVRVTEKILRGRERGETIIVTGATEVTDQEVTQLLKQSPYKDIVEQKHKRVIRKKDDSLIGGYVIRTKSKQIDTSYKRKLLNLYQSITK